MYVCMYIDIGRPSWNCPLLWAVQLGLGEGPIGIVGPISKPRGTSNSASLKLYHTYALVFSDLTLLYAAKVSCVLM